MALSQESILSFLLERGGKVRNSDFLNHFRSRIHSNDPAEKQHNRDLFKKLVNSVAVVRTMDETKFVVVKKRYLDFIKDKDAQMDESLSNPSVSSCASPPCPPSVRAAHSDIENNNRPNLNGSYGADPEDCVQSEPGSSPNRGDATTLRVLNILAHQRTRMGRGGSVFALVAVKSTVHDEPHHRDAEEAVLVAKVSPTNPPKPEFFPAHNNGGDLDGWESGQAGDVMPPVRPPQSKNAKQGEEAKESECVPLDPVAHEWLVKCAAGLWGQVYALFLQDIDLIHRKDFMSGFTMLHWAAKEGNCDMMRKIMDIARKRGALVNVNVKAHGGYTPLHIAAIHRRTKVLFLLVQGYRANVNIRDNDGKKALHYLGNNVLAEVKVLLGAELPSKYGDKKNEQYKQSTNKSIISKRFHSHKGKKHRVTKKYAQDW